MTCTCTTAVFVYIIMEHREKTSKPFHAFLNEDSARAGRELVR